jgi:hypothetical protein
VDRRRRTIYNTAQHGGYQDLLLDRARAAYDLDTRVDMIERTARPARRKEQQ